MQQYFRLTFAWHASRIAFGPATVAPIGGASLRSHMAAAPERASDKDRHDKHPGPVALDRADKATPFVAPTRLEPDKERMKAVELAFGQIEKQFCKGAIMRLGGKDAISPIPAISTGSISIDWALGVGGLPRGRVVEIFGPESSGKTTLAL